MSRLFLDNDAIHKLSIVYLLDEAIETLAGNEAETFVLSTFKFRWKKKSKALPADVLVLVTALLSRSKELTATPKPELLEQMANVDGIDEGEAILFALAADDDLALVTTGDKRSIRALAQTAECAGLVAALAGRVVILEQVLLRLIEAKGFPFVHDRVLRCQDLSDTALRSAFGSREQATEQGVVDALNYYIEDLRKVAGSLLAP